MIDDINNLDQKYSKEAKQKISDSLIGEYLPLTKKKNYYRDLRHKSNISSHYARYAISILMLNHFTSGLDALSTSSKNNFRIGNLSMKLLPYSAYNEGGVLFNISW